MSDVEIVRAALEQIKAKERSIAWNRCIDCDHPSQCSAEKGCKMVNDLGGTKVEKLARAALPALSRLEAEGERLRGVADRLRARWDDYEKFCGLCGVRSVDLDPQTHWRECPEHPALARVGELEGLLRDLFFMYCDDMHITDERDVPLLARVNTALEQADGKAD